MDLKEKRPYVICHMVTSVDGKISGDYFSLPEMRSALGANRALVLNIEHDAILNGTLTSAEIYADGYVSSLPKVGRAYGREDYVKTETELKSVICIDTEGTLNWSGPTARRRAETFRVIAVLCESVSDDYIGFLREKGVSYIFAGKECLDIPILMRKLSDIGIQRILTTGGGIMNWSLIKSGCIDELSVLILPAASGEKDAAGLFSRSEFANGGAEALTLVQAQVVDGSSVLLKYTPVRRS